MDKYTGKRLDSRYEIHELIGVGGMAVVYRAYDIEEDKIVAIKILKDEYLGNKEFIKRFKNESKAIAVLSHPNIVKVYDVSFGTKIQYIVMEYIDGITLKEYISNREKVKWSEAVYFTQQILCALYHAHSKGVIHRDIKPQNIMLLKDGNIKVTDFGIARFCTNETQTMMDRAIGSVHYIAPEQAKGKPVDEKVDIYSVGVMLYEMLTGRLPFEADNAVSVAIMQMQISPEPPRKINPSIPEGLEAITLHAMEKNPANRYTSADAMLMDIEKFQENPEIKFNYKHFVDENPTKYIEVADGQDSSAIYGDNYKYSEKKNKSKPAYTFVMGGIATAVALFALIFVFIVGFNSCGSSASRDVEVPNFVGMTLSEVQDNPEYKFVFKIDSVYDSSKPEGVIIDQDPRSNSKKIKEGATITLKVNSSGVLITVPSLKGATEEVAKARLNNVGLKCEVLMVVDDETAEGLVRSSDPHEGSKVTADSTVRLYVSKGPSDKKINMPDVIDKTLEEARNEITSKGLTVSDSIVYEKSDKPKGTVISSNPLPGVEVSSGSPVSLMVSSGVKKDKRIEVKVDLPQNIDKKVLISAYIDGVASDIAEVVPAYGDVYTVYVNGNSGKKTVTIEINGQKYRVYEVNFDVSSNNVRRTASYDFKENNDTQNNNPNANSDEENEDSIYARSTTPVFKQNPG